MATPLPKYAAESDMDGIRRPPSGNTPKSPIPGLIMLAMLIAIIIAVPKLKPEYSVQNQTKGQSPNTEYQYDGKPEVETEASISDDFTKVTINLKIKNTLKKPIIKTDITYEIKDKNGNEITSTQKVIAQIILPDSEYEDTETIDLGSVQKNGLQTNTNLLYHFLT